MIIDEATSNLKLQAAYLTWGPWKNCPWQGRTMIDSCFKLIRLSGGRVHESIQADSCRIVKIRGRINGALLDAELFRLS
jgi:hypothetical protein